MIGPDANPRSRMVGGRENGVLEMAAKKKAGAAKGAGKKGDSMIISKSRVKAAAKKCNVGSEFYGALEAHVRSVIAQAEARAASNGRKTLRPYDV
jgi:histone H3/H4